MPTTPTYSFPYPASTDFVKDGATNIQNLATAVEDVIEILPVRTGDLIQNGSMRVWQRGTSRTGIGDTGGGLGVTFTADRWNMRVASSALAGTWRMDQKIAAADRAPGSAAVLRIECTTARSASSVNWVYLSQIIENISAASLNKGTTNARQLSLSYYWRANRTGTYNATIRDRLNARWVSQSFTYTTANAWQLVQLTFPADTTGTIPFSTAGDLELVIHILAGSNYTGSPRVTTWTPEGTSSNIATGQVEIGQAIGDYVEITNVQLVPGGLNKSFVQRPYADLLAECQRYYYRFADGITGVDLSIGRATSTTVAHFSYAAAIPMRIAPTAIVQSGTAAHYAIVSGTTVTNCSAVPALLTSTTRTLNWSMTVASGLTLGHAVGARMVNAAATLAFTADYS